MIVRSARGLLLALCPIALLVGLGLVATYIRLLHSPISLKFLVAPIERGISAELGGTGVRIEDAMVRLTDAGGFEFRLRNVRVVDAEGVPIASAPLAAVELASAALFNGKVAPTRVELIDPRLLLFYSDDGGLALSFPRTPDGAGDASRPDAATAPPADFAGWQVGARIDLARAIAQTSARARTGTGAGSYLREIGLRNATVVIDHAGSNNGTTVWRVPEVAIDLDHKQGRSVISGKATIVSGRAPWSLAFRTEDSEKSQTVTLKAAVRDLVPSSLSRALPQLALLEGLDLPVAGNVNFELSTAGELMSGDASVELARGRVQLPWLANATFPVDAGLLNLRYERSTQRIEMTPSTLRWGQSRITLAGGLTSVRTTANEPGWQLDIHSVDGALAAEEFNVKPVQVQALTVSGFVSQQRHFLQIANLQLKVGGSEITLAGVVDAPTDQQVDARFEGRIGPMPLNVVKAIWPRPLGPIARTWIGENLTKANITGGTFLWLAGSQLGQKPELGAPEQRLSLALEATDVAMRPVKTMSPVEAPRALVRLEGAGLEITMPDATVVLPGSRRIPLKSGRMTVADVFIERSIGEISFRTQSALGPVLELLDQEPLGFIRQMRLQTETIDGKVDAQVKLTLPLSQGVETRDVKVEGKARITEARGKQLIGPYDVQGATIAIDVGERAVEARGEMIVSGTVAKLNWQRFFDLPADKQQPPLRLTATLDNSDRNQLGLDVNHIIQGEVPVEITVMQPVKDEPQVHLRADLTNAEMILENLAWKKAPGRAAYLQFGIVKGKGRTELQDFKIVGDDIAADGWLVVGADNRLREFSFPSFTLNLVTKLEMQGVLRADNVLDVKVKGRHYEGREFFRSLFSVGQVADKPLAPQKPRAGVDLTAEIDTLAGFSDVSLRNLKVRVSKRGDKLEIIDATGTLDGGKPVVVKLRHAPGEARKLFADSTDAGQALKLVGFYPNIQGGRVRLEVNLDGRGPAEKTGILWIEQFRVLGDPVVNQVVSSSSGETARATGKQGGTVMRQVFDFDRMRVPFSVGHGQFVMEDSYLRGQLLGASIRGKVDFKAQRMSLGGTYVPLQGLNNIMGGIPVIGDLLSGPRREGLFGITFAVQGSMEQPQVIVNPLSLLTPGFLRGLMEMTNPDPQVIPRDERPAGQPQVRSSSTQPAQRGPANGGPGRAEPEVMGGWSSEAPPAQPKKK